MRFEKIEESLKTFAEQVEEQKNEKTKKNIINKIKEKKLALMKC